MYVVVTYCLAVLPVLTQCRAPQVPPVFGFSRAARCAAACHGCLASRMSGAKLRRDKPRTGAPCVWRRLVLLQISLVETSAVQVLGVSLLFEHIRRSSRVHAPDRALGSQHEACRHVGPRLRESIGHLAPTDRVTEWPGNRARQRAQPCGFGARWRPLAPWPPP